MTEAGTRLEKPMADSDPQTPLPADPAPASPRPSKGRQWRGGFAMRRPALSPRAMAAILALLVLLAFSTWVQLRLVGVAGGQAVVVDTARYVEMAQGFQEWRSGRGPLAGDLVRTPGFPLLLLYAAESVDVTIAETVLVAQRWSGTNAQGRTLITRVLEIQCALAVLVPLLIYLMVLAASRSIALAVLAAFFYFTDPVTLSFQFVLATESLSVVLLFS